MLANRRLLLAEFGPRLLRALDELLSGSPLRELKVPDTLGAMVTIAIIYQVKEIERLRAHKELLVAKTFARLLDSHAE